MKKRFFVTVVFLLIFSLLAACSSSSSSTSEDGGSAKKYNWALTSSFPAGHNMNDVLHNIKDELDKRTDGAINVTIHEDTLGKPPEAWDMTKDNTIQITYTAEGYNTSRMPVTQMIALPFEVTDPTTTLEVLQKWEEEGHLAELTDNFKVLGYVPISASHLFLRDKKVEKMEDLKGLKIRAVSSTQAETLSALGASGVTISGSEVYMSLDRGVIDGTLTGIDNIHDRKLFETADYALKLPLYEATFTLLMNKETWDSLSPELQKTVQETVDELTAQELKRVEAMDQELWDKLEKDGLMEVYTLSEEEQKRWHEETKHVAEKYAEELEKQGYPGKAALESMREAASK
ncbi:TRAP transporter substrate-binding protein [Niallia endozanthoxylica]|uniref:TRAP transporter substrate-binding protein n=1 Tax=Niallia endozanthoxylica TaxID=2036016 RepID=A0A5J5I1X8_9BACI|nr:TRAP transporter substrate-binding protein [Niallia endozanthoxylica]KAA9028595.1 TRAP transporter substrate-binding protein [Niallia endozanthoxylica]